MSTCNSHFNRVHLCADVVQSEDYELFEKDRALTSHAFVASKRGRTSTFDIDKYPVRGLENLIEDRLGKSYEGEKKALNKALKAEEERQKAEGVFPDMDKMRKVSLAHTTASRDRALALAQHDAREARKVKS